MGIGMLTYYLKCFTTLFQPSIMQKGWPDAGKKHFCNLLSLVFLFSFSKMLSFLVQEFGLDFFFTSLQNSLYSSCFQKTKTDFAFKMNLN